jgi:hypothetical protein
MPKIRQAIAVLAAAAFCIGFNTYRYPVVSEMVAVVSSPAPSAETESTPKTDTAEKTLNRGGASQPAAKEKPDGVACKDGVCTMPLPGSPTASLRSTSPRDSAEAASERDEEEVPRRVEADDGGDSKSRVPEEDESLSGLSSEEESNARDEAANPETTDPSVKSTEPDASTESDAPAAPSYEGPEQPPVPKLGARFVSTSDVRRTAEAGQEKPSTTNMSLRPIVRPTPRAKDSDRAAARAASGLRSSGQQGSRGQKVRRLPTVDSESGAEPPDVAADLVHTYPVTSPK